MEGRRGNTTRTIPGINLVEKLQLCFQTIVVRWNAVPSKSESHNRRRRARASEGISKVQISKYPTSVTVTRTR